MADDFEDYVATPWGMMPMKGKVNEHEKKPPLPMNGKHLAWIADRAAVLGYFQEGHFDVLDAEFIVCAYRDWIAKGQPEGVWRIPKTEVDKEEFEALEKRVEQPGKVLPNLAKTIKEIKNDR